MSKRALLLALSLGLLASCVRKKYETPITKNTQQPDKVLFDSAMKDIEHGRYEVARISLQTLMNTYESSEFLAKAKLPLPIVGSARAAQTVWRRPKLSTKTSTCSIPTWKSPLKRKIAFATSTISRWIRATGTLFRLCAPKTECKDLITQYPNSKFVPDATQKLRDIQESLAIHEAVVSNSI